MRKIGGFLVWLMIAPIIWLLMKMGLWDDE